MALPFKQYIILFILSIYTLSISACHLTIPGLYMGKTSEEIHLASDGKTKQITFTASDGTIINFIVLNNQIIDSLSYYSSSFKKNLTNQEIKLPYIYNIGYGDVLRITVWDHPELNNPGISSIANTAKTANDVLIATASNDPLGRIVAMDGTIYFPYIGTIKIAGMSIAQIRKLLTYRLSKYIRNPQLDVSISIYRSQKIYISGEVLHPGVTTLSEIPMTISDLISSVGGLTANADLCNASLIRNGRYIPINLYALFYKGDISNNYRLYAGDRLNIPDNRYNKVFILGEIIRPTSIIIPKGTYTVAEALSDSGGLNQITANASQVYVIRSVHRKKIVNAYIINLKLPTSLMLADQFILKPRDIVFVDPSNITRFTRVVTQILPFLSGTNTAVNTMHSFN